MPFKKETCLSITFKSKELFILAIVCFISWVFCVLAFCESLPKKAMIL